MKQIQDKDIETLTSLGLTVLQAKVYLTLVESGSLTIRELSKAAGVARQDLYRITSELHELELVEKVIAIPTEFRAIELKCGVAILLQRAQENVAKSQLKIRELLQRHKEKKAKPNLQNEESMFILIPENTSVMRKTTQSMENAQTSIDIVISWRKFSRMMLDAQDLVTKALERGIKFRFITEKPEDKKELQKIVKTYREKYSFEIRYLLAPPSAHIGLFDRKEVYINTSTKQDLAQTPLLWSNNSSLIEVVHNYFDVLWLTAMEEYKTAV